jgi:antitoxin (DNA-binding transcriptional repressor) of toxin-antitoxin stability system
MTWLVGAADGGGIRTVGLREGGQRSSGDKMRSISSVRASDRLGPILSRVAKGERVILRSGRKAVAAVVPLKDLKLLEPRRVRSVQLTPAEIREVRKARAELGSVSAEALFRELGL